MWDPGCDRWDLGHPVEFVLGQLDAMAAKYPPGTSEDDLEWASQEGEWYLLFRKLRQFFNSEYETYDPDLQISTFEGVLERVLCHPYSPTDGEPTEPPDEPDVPSEDAGSTDADAGSAGGDAQTPVDDAGPTPDAGAGGGLIPEVCPVHDWLRGQWALYLLYTKFSVDGEWYNWPALTDEQIVVLYDAFFELIVHADQPASVKQTIINKLPTSSVPAAADFLQQLHEHFDGIEDKEGWEQQIFGWIQNSMG